MIKIDYRDHRPIYEQIKDEFKNLIFHGLIESDEQMPSVRDLSSKLAINPNTIQRAYKELENEGYIYSVKGRGSFAASPDRAQTELKKAKLFSELDAIVEELLYLGVSAAQIAEKIKGRE